MHMYIIIFCRWLSLIIAHDTWIKILPAHLSFALIPWLEKHHVRFNMYPAPIEVWSPSSGVLSFIPVASIVSRAAVMKDNNNSIIVYFDN